MHHIFNDGRPQSNRAHKQKTAKKAGAVLYLWPAFNVSALNPTHYQNNTDTRPRQGNLCKSDILEYFEGKQEIELSCMQSD